jgi:hypothetical protein
MMLRLSELNKGCHWNGFQAAPPSHYSIQLPHTLLMWLRTSCNRMHAVLDSVGMPVFIITMLLTWMSKRQGQPSIRKDLDVHTEDRQTSIKKPRRHDTPSFGVQQGDLRMGQPPNAHQYTECGLFNLSEPCDAVRATSRANQESQAITRLMHASSEGRHEPPRKTRRLHERNFSDSAKSRLKEVETTELFVSTSSASSSNPLQPQRDVIPKGECTPPRSCRKF